jgi:hypothetical protein
VGPIRPVRRNDPATPPVEPVRPAILSPIEREEARRRREEARQRREQARRKVLEREKKNAQDPSRGVDHLG